MPDTCAIDVCRRLADADIDYTIADIEDALGVPRRTERAALDALAEEVED
jgi:hypothetical protein